jgi:hypothetical protein
MTQEVISMARSTAAYLKKSFFSTNGMEDEVLSNGHRGHQTSNSFLLFSVVIYILFIKRSAEEREEKIKPGCTKIMI